MYELCMKKTLKESIFTIHLAKNAAMVTGTIVIIALSFLICFYTIPILLKIANRFSIYDTPNHIKKHNRKITFLGGVALLISFIIPASLFMPDEVLKPVYFNSYLIIITVIFLHGLGDDFFNYAAKRKFTVQIILSSLLIYKTGYYIPLEHLLTSFNIPESISFLVTLLSAVAIINAYNLIDGADGLAASFSIIASVFYAYCLYVDGNIFFSILAMSSAASLFAFLLYNKPPAHIFMGDSGSLFLGLLLTTFTFAFIEDAPASSILSISNRVILAFSFISIPLLDMVRLFVIRIYNRKNPFSGDNNHIHHLMADIGFTSKQTLLIIITFQLFNIGIAFLALGKSWLGFILINVCTYIILIQLLRQIKTFLRQINFRGMAESATEADNEEIKETEGKVISGQ